MANLTGFEFDRDGAYIFKSPAASLQYALDFSEYLNTGDTIVDDSSASSPVVTIGTISGDSAPLIHPNGHGTDVSATTTKVTFRVSGGTAGNVYPITVKIATSAGDIDTRHFRIICKDKGLE